MPQVNRPTGICRWLILIMAILLATAAPAHAGITLRVGLEQNPPLAAVASNGTAQGLTVDILNQIAAREGWTIEYFPCVWSRCLELLENGELDLVVSIAFSDERNKVFDFNRSTVASNWGQIYSPPNERIESYLDLQGKRIAVVKGDIYADTLMEMLDRFGVKAFFVPVDRFSDVFQMIELGNVDAGVANRFFTQKNQGNYSVRATSLIFSPVSIRYAAPKGKHSDILAAIDRNLEEMKADQGSAYYHSLERWIGGEHARGHSHRFWLIITGVSATALIMFGFNLVLRSTVRVKTAVLETEIAERKRAEEKLREKERHLADIIDFLPDATWVIDCEGKVIAWNRACEELTGIKAEDMVGKGDYEYAIPFYGERRKVLIDIALTPAPEQERTYVDFRRDGDTVTAEAFQPHLLSKGLYLWGTASRLYNASGAVIGAIESVRNITDRVNAKKSLMESERKYREVVENANSIILRMDTSGHVTFFNEFAQKFFDYSEEEIIGRHVVGTIVSPCDANEKNLVKMIEDICDNPEKYALNENENIRKNGEVVHISWSNRACRGENGAGMEILCVGQDITERVRLQEIMMQSEKMMMIGGLAAGMAHELNNPLGAIIQNIQNIQRRISPGLLANETAARQAGIEFSQLRDYLDRRGIIEMLQYISDSGARAAEIIANMLTFSRKSVSRREETALPNIIDKALELAACDYELKKHYDFRNIQIIRQYDENLPVVALNPLEIEQVILNLLKNAAQALAEKPTATPRIVIRAKRQEQHAVIEVEDNGPGISEDISDRIFEPFFTTKEVGVGTGLGLSVSYAIIANNHRGSISVDSPPDKGTRFTIRLPI